MSGGASTREPSREEQGVFIQPLRQGDKGGLQQNPPRAADINVTVSGGETCHEGTEPTASL